MAKVLLALTVAVLLFPAGARADSFVAPPAAQSLAMTLPPGFAASTPWTIPDYATAVRFAPDGRVFVAGKGGQIYVFDGLADSTPTVFADLSQEVYAAWDRGLLGLAIDPQYANGRPYLYVAYTYDKAPGDATVPRWSDTCPDPPGFDNGCVVAGRVSRIAPDGSETVLLEDFCDQSASHSMGGLAFGPDGALYVSAGDGAAYNNADYGGTGDPKNPCGDPPGGVGTALTPPTALGGALRAQSYRRAAGQPVSLDGTILRIDPDTGLASSGNPGGPDAQRRRIVAYGFRNPFRFAFRPGTGELWVGDVGFGAWEEIDRVPDITKVRNYGWPCYEGDARQDSYDALDLDACESLYGQGGVELPFYAYSHADAVAGCAAAGSSISGMAFYDAAAFPAFYRGRLFFADYSRQCIWTVSPDEANPQPQIFAADAGGPVDLQVGPDGALYYPDVFAGEIRRIAPTGGAPTAVIDADRDSGSVPLTVRLDGGRSSGAGPLRYEWDLDGDGSYDDSTAARPPAREYTGSGYVTVRLRVTDAGGASGTASRLITVGTPPAVTIASPTAATTWAVGDTIGYAGSAVDSTGRALPASALHWTLDMRHCPGSACHTHRIQDFDGVATGSFVAPDHEYPSHLELSLTATDASCLTTTQTLALQPRTVNLSVTSTPPGARIALGTAAGTAPFTRAVIANSDTTVSAQSPQSIGAASYVFGQWNDGGAATHTVRAPLTGTKSLGVQFGQVQDALLAGSETVNPDLTSRATPGQGEAYQLPPAAKSGTVLALRLRLGAGSTASRLALGLYSEGDGDAAVLLGSGTLTAPVADDWNTVRLASPVTISAGTRYWLALLNPAGGSGTLVWHDRAGAAAPEHTTPRGQLVSELPATWMTGNVFDGGPVAGGAYGVAGNGQALRMAAAGARSAQAHAAAEPDAGGCPPPPSHDVVTTAPSTSPTPAPGVTPPPAVKPKPKPAKQPRLRAPSSLRMNRHGVVRIRVKCPQACRVTATLSRGHHRLGRAKAKARAGHTATLRLHLSKRGRALVRHRQRLTLRVTRRSGGKTQAARKTLRVRR